MCSIINGTNYLLVEAVLFTKDHRQLKGSSIFGTRLTFTFADGNYLQIMFWLVEVFLDYFRYLMMGKTSKTNPAQQAGSAETQNAHNEDLVPQKKGGQEAAVSSAGLGKSPMNGKDQNKSSGNGGSTSK